MRWANPRQVMKDEFNTILEDDSAYHVRILIGSRGCSLGFRAVALMIHAPPRTPPHLIHRSSLFFHARLGGNLSSSTVKSFNQISTVSRPRAAKATRGQCGLVG